MAPPISVQSQKLIGWLVERGALSKDYMKSLSQLSIKLDEFENKSSEKIKSIQKNPVLYLFAVDVLKYLEKTDDCKDFFGRASSSIRTLKDIIARYESSHVHLADLAERLNDLCFQIPKYRAIIADRQKFISDSQRRIQYFTNNQQTKASELDQFRKRFNIKDDYVRLQLLEKAATVPEILASFVDTLQTLKPALDFYTSFTSYLHNKASMGDARRPCGTLRILINSGHLTVFEWRTRQKPMVIGESDDCLPILLEQERRHVEILQREKEAVADEQGAQLYELDEDDVNLDDIDFGDLDDNFNIQEVTTEELATTVENDELPLTPASKTSGKVPTATGSSARLLLDSVEGRNALINDLEELTSFLHGMADNQRDHSDGIGGHKKNSGAGGISMDAIAPIYQQIMQDAPASVSAISVEEINKMSKAVQDVKRKLTDETLNHLVMLRLQPNYLERLIETMADLKRQSDRAKTQLLETNASIQQADQELTALQIELQTSIQERKQLVNFLETELTKLYDREIRLVGAAISL